MSEKILKATHGSPDRPLKIGDLEIPCYVLENGMRVLSGRGMQTALSLGQRHGALLKAFIDEKTIQPFINEDLAMVLSTPVRFTRPGRGGKVALGYEATILADICDAVLAARKAGKLSPRYKEIADRCEILVRGFARVGIIALVDEATGYQAERARNALHEILEKFIAKELQPWIKTFSDEFYMQIFRLNNWPYTAESIKKRPGVIGTWTNDIIYKRLAPGVKEELHRVAERDEKGRPKHRLFQRLTEDTGHPKLKEHIASVTALMRASSAWRGFLRLLARAFPKYPTQGEFPFMEEDDKE